MSTSLPKPHHTRREFCHCRKAYREGREPKAVKVYTVAQESNYVIVQGIPALGLHKDLMREFLAFGAVDEHRLLDDYPAEEFTEVLLIKFAKLQSARLAKRKMDNLNYCGGHLHVFYAPEYESIDDTRRKLQEQRRTIAWRLRLLSADSNGKDTQLSAPVEMHEDDSKESSVGTLNVNESETSYMQPTLLPPPPVAIPTQSLPLPPSQILHQNHPQPVLLTNYSRCFSATSNTLSFTRVPTQPLPHAVPLYYSFQAPPPLPVSHVVPVNHSLPTHVPSHPPPSDISSLKPPPDSVLDHRSQIHHARTRLYRPPFRGPRMHLDRPIHSIPRRSDQPTLPSAVDTSKLNYASNSSNLEAASEDYLGSRVERVPISAKLLSNSNRTPIVKSYTNPGPVPRFIPRQLVKRQTDAKNTAAQPIEKLPDPVNEDLKKMALTLGSMPQGPALPPQEERKRQLFRSSETGNASLDETVAIIREKVTQTTSMEPPTKKLKPS